MNDDHGLLKYFTHHVRRINARTKFHVFVGLSIHSDHIISQILTKQLFT
jgi:hypothetical protein